MNLQQSQCSPPAKSDQSHDGDYCRSWYREVRLMKVSRAWSCLLLLGAVLNFSGCDQIRKIFGNDGGGGGVHGLTTATVSINGCSVVDPSTGKVVDPIVQKARTPVTWNFSDQKVYVITFNPKYDKTSHSNITPPANSITHTSKRLSGITPALPLTADRHHDQQGQRLLFQIQHLVRGNAGGTGTAL